MTMLSANGLSLAYERFGARDAQPLLLIAGLGVQMIRWKTGFCEMLAGLGFQVIRFDNRDAGLSTHLTQYPPPDFPSLAAQLMRGEKPAVPYRLGDMAQDSIGLLQALDLGPAHIVGRSMGGMIGQIIASRHPEWALSLTSIMSSTGNPALPPPTPEAMAVLTSPAPDPRQDEEAYLDQAVAGAQALSGPGFAFDAEAQRTQARAEWRRAFDPAGFLRQLGAVAVEGDRRAELGRITVPSLAVHGSADPLVPLAAGQDTAAHIPGAEMMVIDGMGHDLPAAVFDRVAAAIAANARRSKA